MFKVINWLGKKVQYKTTRNTNWFFLWPVSLFLNCWWTIAAFLWVEIKCWIENCVTVKINHIIVKAMYWNSETFFVIVFVIINLWVEIGTLLLKPSNKTFFKKFQKYRIYKVFWHSYFTKTLRKSRKRKKDRLTVFIGNQSLIFCRRIFMSGVPKEKKI